MARFFLKRFYLAPRKISNSKQGSVLERIRQGFSCQVRLFSSLGNGPIDNKWGRFLPSCRWNGDQVPLSFVYAPSETFEEKVAKRVWIAQMEEGMTKHFEWGDVCVLGGGAPHILSIF